MGISLREKRRRQTARDIQLAAVVVTLRSGYEHTTTEAIAAEAGISTRTFFNYYNNKQAAILGEAPAFAAAQTDWFTTSNRPILDDISRLLGQAVEGWQLDRQVLNKIFELVERTPALLPLFRQRLEDIAAVVTRLLESRLGSARRYEARLLAELSTHALSEAVQIWARDDALFDEDITRLARGALHSVGNILCQNATAPTESRVSI